MKKYTAYLIQAMSQIVEFEAPEDATVEDLETLAAKLGDFGPKAGDDYDTDGDVEIYYVKNDQDEIVGGTEFKED